MPTSKNISSTKMKELSKDEYEILMNLEEIFKKEAIKYNIDIKLIEQYGSYHFHPVFKKNIRTNK